MKPLKIAENITTLINTIESVITTTAIKEFVTEEESNRESCAGHSVNQQQKIIHNCQRKVIAFKT